MSELKFKIWDPTLKIMTSPVDIFQLTSFSFESTDKIKSVKTEFPPETIFRRFIGVRDEEGTEIYEGDIVEAWSAGANGIFEVRWRQEGSPCWILFPAWQKGAMWYISATEHKPGKKFISVDGMISETIRTGFFDDGLKIIGNIYEHPEKIRSHEKK